MNNRTVAFLRESGIGSSESLIQKVSDFVRPNVQKVLYRRRELYFLHNENIVESMRCDGSVNAIVEFDGNTINHIDNSYYLGENGRMLSIDMLHETDDGGESSNNNNNNNNNGNNGNNG